MTYYWRTGLTWETGGRRLLCTARSAIQSRNSEDSMIIRIYILLYTAEHFFHKDGTDTEQGIALHARGRDHTPNDIVTLPTIKAIRLDRLAPQRAQSASLRKEGMPVVKHLAILLIKVAIVCNGMLGLQAGHSEPLGSIFSGKDAVRPSGAVYVRLVGHVEDRA